MYRLNAYEKLLQQDCGGDKALFLTYNMNLLFKWPKCHAYSGVLSRRNVMDFMENTNMPYSIQDFDDHGLSGSLIAKLKLPKFVRNRRTGISNPMSRVDLESFSYQDDVEGFLDHIFDRFLQVNWVNI